MRKDVKKGAKKGVKAKLRIRRFERAKREFRWKRLPKS